MGNAQFHETTGSTPGCTPHCGAANHKKQDNNVIANEEATQQDPQQQQQQQPARESRARYVLKTIKTTIRDIFDPPEPERLPPKRFAPKHMLYGCQSTDEHYDYIDAICEKVASLHGKEGLMAMGFEYRMVHHTKNCSCAGVAQGLVGNANEEDELTDSEADPEEMKEGYMESSEEGDEYGQFDEGSEEPENQEQFLVPLGAPLNLLEHHHKLETIFSAASLPSTSTNYPLQTSSYASSTVSRNTSALSLFSLATHNTDFSNSTTWGDEGSCRQHRKNSTTPRNNTKSARFPLESIASAPKLVAMEQDSCALRLHHTTTGTMITAANHSTYFADGKFYDELARLCMEYAQQVMMEEADLEWVAVSKGPKEEYGAVINRSFYENRRAARENRTKCQTLLVVTGKGQVNAGIFSRRHLLVSSMEAATALPFIRGAQEREMNIVMLDPNALGYRNAMDVVETSLEHFFLADGKCVEEHEEVYVLAHSMAGAQIVRFFIDSSSSHSRPPPTQDSAASKGMRNDGLVSTVSANVGSSGGDTSDKKVLRSQLLQRVKAFAFTDSNHNINWVKNHLQLTRALTGPPSLYIKSHKVHEKAKELGQAHHDCQFWRHRFGDIKTLWAGTHEHALTNYTARAHIWEHFDQFLKQLPQ